MSKGVKKFAIITLGGLVLLCTWAAFQPSHPAARGPLPGNGADPAQFAPARVCPDTGHGGYKGGGSVNNYHSKLFTGYVECEDGTIYRYEDGDLVP
jgi:hypothetical protein